MSLLTLDDIKKCVKCLPALSTAVTELLNQIDRENVDNESIAEKILNDQVLTAKTLRLANSSFYGMQYKVKTIPEAISVLGLRNIKTIATATAIAGSFSKVQIKGLDLLLFWQHTIASAVFARKLARQIRRDADQAFMAGLMHDIGKLVLATCFEDKYAQVIAYQQSHGSYPREAEKHVLGCDHTQVGKLLAEHWKFPPEIQDAVEMHHTESPETAPYLAQILYMADVLSHKLIPSEGNGEYHAPPSLWEKFQIFDDNFEEFMDDAEAQIEEIRQALLG